MHPRFMIVPIHPAKPPEQGKPRLGPAIEGMPTRIRMALETVAFFAVLMAVDHTLLSGHAFAELEPNPYWLPVLTLSVCYGSGMGLAAALTATAIWVLAPHSAPGGDHLQLMLSISILPMLWVIVALIVGELTTSRLEAIQRLQRVRTRHKEELRELAGTVEHLAETNRALQVRIATEEHTVGRAIAAAVDLVEEDPLRQAHGLERLVALSAQSEDFIYYTGVGDRFVARFRGHAAAHRPDALSGTELAEVLAQSRARPTPAEVTPAAPVLLALPVHCPHEQVLAGLLVINNLCPSELTTSKQAELAQVALSLGQLSHLPCVAPAPLAESGLLLREGVA